MAAAKKKSPLPKGAGKKSPSVIESAITHHIGIRELRQDASKVMAIVESGQTLVVTRHGRAIATINPIVKDKFQHLLELGMITPATEKFDFRNWKPKSPPASAELLAAALREIRESRF
jgi:prevent-host-death family protein